MENEKQKSVNSHEAAAVRSVWPLQALRVDLQQLNSESG